MIEQLLNRIYSLIICLILGFVNDAFKFILALLRVGIGKKIFIAHA